MARGSRRKSSGRQPSSTKRARPSLDLAAIDEDDEHVHSSSDEDDDRLAGVEPEDEDDEDEELETLDAKKVRLARSYLDKLDKAEDSTSDESESEVEHDDTEDRLGYKLQRSRLKREGTWERAVAGKLESSIQSLQKSVTKRSTASTAAPKSAEAQAKDWVTSGYVQLLRGHDLTVTSVALQADGTKAISGSKDHSVLLWDVERAERLATLSPHWKRETATTPTSRTAGQVLAVALSDDGRYAALGRRDATVSIFDVRSRQNVQTFTGHKGPVTCLTFRSQSYQLFSGSEDRCIRHYNLAELMYLETLYGHQFGVTDIDCANIEQPVSVSSDRTARAWKLDQDTHLIFRGGSKIPAADCLSVLKDDWFVTGHQDGTVSLWRTDKKRAVATLDAVHGRDLYNGIGNGICSVASLRHSDVAMSGSKDGWLRLYKVRTGATLAERGMEVLQSKIPVHGYINQIAVGPKAKFCVLAIGQEHRLGRFDRVARAKNRVAIVQLQQPALDTNDDEDE